MTDTVIYTLLIALGLLAVLAFSNPAVAAQSARVCDAYARNYATNASRQGQVLGRGAVGSALGAGIGAAFGGAAVELFYLAEPTALAFPALIGLVPFLATEDPQAGRIQLLILLLGNLV